MKNQLVTGGVYAMFVAAALATACGPQARTGLGDAQSSTAALAQQDDDDGDDGDDDDGDEEDGPSANCDELRQKVQVDAFAMQMTMEFQEMSQTSEYRKLEATMLKMQSKGCTFNGKASPACNKLRSQAMRQQQDLVRTPEFAALAKTPEFKRFMEDAREAMENDCLGGMGMGIAGMMTQLFIAL